MLLVVSWTSLLKNLSHLENIKLEIKFDLNAVHVFICTVYGFKSVLFALDLYILRKVLSFTAEKENNSISLFLRNSFS